MNGRYLYPHSIGILFLKTTPESERNYRLVDVVVSSHLNRHVPVQRLELEHQLLQRHLFLQRQNAQLRLVKVDQLIPIPHCRILLLLLSRVARRSGVFGSFWVVDIFFFALFLFLFLFCSFDWTSFFVVRIVNLCGHKNNKTDRDQISANNSNPLHYSKKLGIQLLFGYKYRAESGVITWLELYSNRNFKIRLLQFVLYIS